MHINTVPRGMAGLSGDFDFSALLKDITGGVVAYKQAEAQADIAKLQAQTALANQQSSQYSLLTRYSPTYTSGGATGSTDMTPYLLLGAAALMVFFILRK